MVARVAGVGCFIEPWEDSADWLRVFEPLAREMRDEHGPGRPILASACVPMVHRRRRLAGAFEQALLAEEFEVAVSLLQHFSFEHLFKTSERSLVAQPARAAG